MKKRSCRYEMRRKEMILYYSRCNYKGRIEIAKRREGKCYFGGVKGKGRDHWTMRLAARLIISSSCIVVFYCFSSIFNPLSSVTCEALLDILFPSSFCWVCVFPLVDSSNSLSSWMRHLRLLQVIRPKFPLRERYTA